MAENNKNQFKCSGDCLNCRVNPNERRTQWQYCAAQFTYNSMRMIEALHGEMKEIQTKIDAIQNNEASVFNPNEEKPEIPINPIAQEGDGAEE